MLMSESNSAVPNHLGFILDGNRRWAREQGLPVFEGHRVGYGVMREVAEICFNQGVKYVTVYVFSTENWKRPLEEVSYLMNLLLFVAKREVKTAVKEGIRLRFLGRRDVINADILKAIEYAEEATKELTKATLSFCLDYGGQQEIADAARKCMEDGLTPKEITPQALESRLYAPDIPPVDMVIRTSGEQRISNFMLWRVAYSELMFVQKHWPEMTKDDVTAIIEEYNRRTRRFGG